MGMPKEAVVARMKEIEAELDGIGNRPPAALVNTVLYCVFLLTALAVLAGKMQQSIWLGAGVWVAGMALLLVLTARLYAKLRSGAQAQYVIAKLLTSMVEWAVTQHRTHRRPAQQDAGSWIPRFP